MNHASFLKIAVDVLDDNPEIHFLHFDKLMDALLSLFKNRIEKKETQFENERNYFINLLTQKFIIHGFSIKKLIDGISLDSRSKNFSIKLIDPFSIHCLVRAIIENYLVQNYISNLNFDNDLLQLRFEIWMRYGLLQRQINPQTDEAKRVHESDKKSIERLDMAIKTRHAYLELTEDKKISFLKTINKEWKITFNHDKFHPLSWKQLMKEAGIKEGINDQIYNFLSWHAHSQSISILQLKNMWDKNFDKQSIFLSIKKLNMFTSFILSDIIKSDNSFRNSYKDLSEEYQDLINFYNFSFREKEHIVE
ncbi:hypothetical protein GZ212_03280 [Mangrovimonas sp. CR14]|uniref:hypothetical protein n=1 Tax=Mangrovimonas sp. CR14 TaxID=2706120 RepID=UPI00141E2F8E|nr:hypothetical protein [Mangrovimonas sp. CR14]NIK91164.1 hypothetical protein [Mangrovimonas sp. CR14]